MLSSLHRASCRVSLGAIIGFFFPLILFLLIDAQGLKTLLFHLYSDWREKGEGFCSDNKCMFKFHPGSSAEAPVAASGWVHAQLLSDLGGFRQQQKAGCAWGEWRVSPPEGVTDLQCFSLLSSTQNSFCRISNWFKSIFRWCVCIGTLFCTLLLLTVILKEIKNSLNSEFSDFPNVDLFILIIHFPPCHCFLLSIGCFLSS